MRRAIGAALTEGDGEDSVGSEKVLKEEMPTPGSEEERAHSRKPVSNVTRAVDASTRASRSE